VTLLILALLRLEAMALGAVHPAGAVDFTTMKTSPIVGSTSSVSASCARTGRTENFSRTKDSCSAQHGDPTVERFEHRCPFRHLVRAACCGDRPAARAVVATRCAVIALTAGRGRAHRARSLRRIDVMA
jgi:hypothetical protein